MFARKLIQALTLSVAGLIAAPSIGTIVDAGPTEAHAKRSKGGKKGRKAIKRTIARKRDKRRDRRAERSLARTRLVLRAALHSVQKHEDGKGRLIGAVLHQRAAKIALRKDRPGAAMWLTRQARQMARNVIRENRGEMPKGGNDRPGEWQRADESEAPRFLELAKRHRSKKPAAVAEANTTADATVAPEIDPAGEEEELTEETIDEEPEVDDEEAEASE